MTELKPCPFCGGEGTFSTSELPGLSSDMSFYVGCDTCECSTSYEDTGNEAIEKWNTRQPTDNWKPIEELTEEVLENAEKIPFIMMCQAKEPDFYHKHGALGVFILAKNDNDEFLICSNSSNWEVPLSKISETIFTHYKIITPPQTNRNGD